jgi:hypothetical protein
MTITAEITTTAPARDHAISVETAAAELGGLKVATIRRYAKAGKLARLAGGISADSVEAYKVARKANQERTRFKKAPRPVTDLTELTDVELAAEAWAEAARLEAIARDLKKQARPILEAAGPGRHGRFELRFIPGGLVMDQGAVRADYEAREDEVPMKQKADSIKAARVA